MPGDFALGAETRPVLAAKVRIQRDKVTDKPILLYPEGVVVLNETGKIILQLCDGQRTMTDLLVELAVVYETEPEALQDDVSAYLLGLHQHSLIELR
jgi:pyrroloquinoline quinone biosynthesis protein D